MTWSNTRRILPPSGAGGRRAPYPVGCPCGCFAVVSPRRGGCGRGHRVAAPDRILRLRRRRSSSSPSRPAKSVRAVISLDGRRIAYGKDGKVWVRDLDVLLPRSLDLPRRSQTRDLDPGRQHADRLGRYEGVAIVSGEWIRTAASPRPSAPSPRSVSPGEYRRWATTSFSWEWRMAGSTPCRSQPGTPGCCSPATTPPLATRPHRAARQ